MTKLLATSALKSVSDIKIPDVGCAACALHLVRSSFSSMAEHDEGDAKSSGDALVLQMTTEYQEK